MSPLTLGSSECRGARTHPSRPSVAPHLLDRMAEVRLLLLLSLSSLALGAAILALRHQAFNKFLLSVKNIY